MDDTTRAELEAIRQRQSNGYDEASRCDAFKAVVLMLKDMRRCLTIVDEQERERLEIQRALASSVLSDPTEDDEPRYSTIEMVNGIKFLIQQKDACRAQAVALRKELVNEYYARDAESKGKLMATKKTTKKTTKKPRTWFVKKLIKMGACKRRNRIRKNASHVHGGMDFMPLR